MEITKKGKFLTDYYGGTPALGAAGILEKWCNDKSNAWLLSWAEQVKKKGQTAINALEEILSIFHRDAEGNPIIGNWMLRRCLVVTGQTIFNAMKDRSHPKKNIIPMAISLVEPLQIPVYQHDGSRLKETNIATAAIDKKKIYLHNGNVITKPDGVKTYTISLVNRSFFKAYEVINAGATFEATIHFDDELLSEEHMEQILAKCGSIGVGAFRERFGKFVWV